MDFGERYGFEKPMTIQIDTINMSLRNRLYNFYKMWEERVVNREDYSVYVVDKLGFVVSDTYCGNAKRITACFLNEDLEYEWYMPYKILEIFIEYAKLLTEKNMQLYDQYHRKNIENQHLYLISQFTERINPILEEEKSGYRFMNEIFVPITNSLELSAISEAINSIDIPGKYIEKALTLYSDRKNPDYENTIKESISAVESMCCIICNQDGKGATLGKALNNLENNGVKIHPALKGAFQQMYGYTSDTDGIRHGGVDFANASSEDAKYMLVTCSAFVNYLKEKYVKIEINQK